jgi:serine/threonine protein kinase
MVIELLSTNILQFFTLLPERPQLAISHIQCLAKQMLETLSILRALNIVHTDIKPDNILLKR